VQVVDRTQRGECATNKARVLVEVLHVLVVVVASDWHPVFCHHEHHQEVSELREIDIVLHWRTIDRSSRMERFERNRRDTFGHPTGAHTANQYTCTRAI